MEWTKEYIESLPDECFAYVAADGSRHFPYKDKSGKIDLPHLREAMARAPMSKFGAQAMPKLKVAAKMMKMGEYAENWKGGEGYFQGQVQLTSLREQLEGTPKYTKPNDEKREICIPMLLQGWGNPVDNNYYTSKAVTEAASYLQSRKKMYLNHPKSEADDRDIRDWGASIQETWVATLPDGKVATLGRVKILDNWLWERAKAAPEELATSLLGRGKARWGSVEGREGNIIESIEYVKSCDFVDYGGNVPLGMAYFVENDRGDKNNNNEEDTEMQMNEITIGMLKESRQDLVTEITSAAIKEKDAKIAELETKVKEQETAANALKNELDAIKVKEAQAKAQAAKKDLVEKLLKESKLPENAKTDVFKGILMSLEETKAGDKVVSVEEQAKSLIADREAIVIPGSPIKNMGDDKNVQEGDKDAQAAVNKGIFGLEEKKEEKK